jgi:hypothetical protein
MNCPWCELGSIQRDGDDDEMAQRLDGVSHSVVARDPISDRDVREMTLANLKKGLGIDGNTGLNIAFKAAAITFYG